VRYWLMEAVDGEFTPNDEVDVMRWLPAADTEAALTYPHDSELVAAARERLGS
jgi:8-oxo-(d)GTP phosphatase